MATKLTRPTRRGTGGVSLFGNRHTSISKKRLSNSESDALLDNSTLSAANNSSFVDVVSTPLTTKLREKCPCRKSDPESWLLKCVSCSQNWHTNCANICGKIPKEFIKNL